jgi:hypothetical protein
MPMSHVCSKTDSTSLGLEMTSACYGISQPNVAQRLQTSMFMQTNNNGKQIVVGLCN